ncbi:MAG TPA: WD40 repeat domain-containing protein [Kofleriaceae bacterium]|nr:WD40 repeat domain-containing protein [Kofleriaceae bacterium]
MIRTGWASIAWACVAVGCGPQHKQAASPVDPAAMAAAALQTSPRCTPPAEVAVSQRADDYESSRLLVVDVASREVVWRGPTGSGNRPAMWSHDGSMLAYALGEDLIVHRDVGADRLVYRGLDEDAPRFAFSPNDRLIAASSGAGIVVIELAGSGNLHVSAVQTGISCEPERMLWTRDGTRLVVSCGDDGVLEVWSSTERSVTQHELEGVEQIYGWLPAQRDMLVASADGAVIAISLDGTTRRRLRAGRADELFVTNYVEAAGLIEYSDYGPDEGSPRTIWLAQVPAAAAMLPGVPPPIGAPPPLAWIDGPVFDLSYSTDGAWAAFATPGDSMSEAGDVYLARVGDPKVTMVIESPRSEPGDVLRPVRQAQGQDARGEEDLEDPDLDPVYYVGYAAPVPRPAPSSRCRSIPGAPAPLHIARTFDPDAELLPGVILVALENGSFRVHYGDELASIEAPAVEGALGLPGGSLLLAEPGGVRLLGPNGAEHARLPVMDLEHVVAAPDGGFFLFRDLRVIDFFDAAGTRTGSYSATDTIAELSAIAGGAIVSTASGEVITIDGAGKRRAGFQLGAPRRVVGLSPEIQVHAEPAAVDSDAEDYDEYADEWVNLVFESPTGKTLGHYRALSPGSETALLVPMGNGNLAAVTGAERTQLHLLDSRARVRGTFKIGTYSEQPPVVLGDGTVVVRGGSHDLYLIDARGRCLGGITLAEEIYAGPHRLGPSSFAVETDSRVLVLRRQAR